MRLQTGQIVGKKLGDKELEAVECRSALRKKKKNLRKAKRRKGRRDLRKKKTVLFCFVFFPDSRYVSWEKEVGRKEPVRKGLKTHDRETNRPTEVTGESEKLHAPLGENITCEGKDVLRRRKLMCLQDRCLPSLRSEKGHLLKVKGGETGGLQSF